jgi:RNA polymerase sigma factor (sigma-70 family)
MNKELNREAAFVSIIKENEGLIFKITTIYGNDSEDRKDLYQEIVLQLWKAFGQFKGDAKASTWMYRVALNTAISRLRKENKGEVQVAYNEDLIRQTVDDNDALLEEKSKVLYQQIAKLTDLEKAIVLLYLEDKSYGEIAEITGISESNVSTRMSRIKEKLRNKIEANKR